MKNYAELLRAEDRFGDDMQRVALQIAMAYGSNDVTVLGLRIIVDKYGANTEEPGLFHPEKVFSLMSRLLDIGRSIMGPVVLVESWYEGESSLDDDDNISEEESKRIYDMMTDDEYSVYSYAVTTESWMEFQKFILNEPDLERLYSDCEELSQEEKDNFNLTSFVRLLELWAVPMEDRMVWFFSGIEK